MSDEILSLEDFLPYRLNRLADAVSRDFAVIYKDRFGLTRPEWRLLATLGQFGVMTATAVGTHSAMHKTKVSRAVAALERRLWVTRTPEKSDRRVERLTLTKTGRRVYRDLVPVARAFEARFLEAMSEPHRKAVLTSLSLLEDAMNAARQPADNLRAARQTNVAGGRSGRQRTEP